jgi:hypothetical protein
MVSPAVDPAVWGSLQGPLSRRCAPSAISARVSRPIGVTSGKRVTKPMPAVAERVQHALQGGLAHRHGSALGEVRAQQPRRLADCLARVPQHPGCLAQRLAEPFAGLGVEYWQLPPARHVHEGALIGSSAAP